MTHDEFKELNLIMGQEISYDLIARDLVGEEHILQDYRGVFMKFKNKYIHILGSNKDYCSYQLHNIKEIRIKEVSPLTHHKG